MEKKLDENLYLKLKLFSTEIDLERTRSQLFVRESEASNVKLESLQKSLQAFVDSIKSGLEEQGYELTRIDLGKGVVELKEKTKEDVASSEDVAPVEPSAPAQS